MTESYYARNRERLSQYDHERYLKRTGKETTKEYKHSLPHTKRTNLCSHCGSPLKRRRYANNYCSPWCYLQSFRKYRGK